MGKSLAYLLPAAFHSAARGRRVLVSTKTKALQRQLAAHELPLVAAALPPGWRWAVLMGRENYLCRRQLDELLQETAEHLPDPDDGPGARLPRRQGALGRGRSLGAAVPRHARAAGADRAGSPLALVGQRLPRQALPGRTRCHWRLARARAERAHLVCVNHALLLTGSAVLPPFEDVDRRRGPPPPRRGDGGLQRGRRLAARRASSRPMYAAAISSGRWPQRLRVAASTAETGPAQALAAAAERLDGAGRLVCPVSPPTSARRSRCVGAGGARRS